MWLGYIRMSVCHYFFQYLGLGELVNWSAWYSLLPKLMLPPFIRTCSELEKVISCGKYSAVVVFE